ncbi:FtsX-like permease family protein [Catalinimonas niigatensis]|uniref:FtsX-like permease family protein n=1 Tax=Catalinimonas niigatensis TaxID=1397264 RepID=UPI002666B652|nr:FtsX-like permease family protein [Catalinimonas niigatensis]WPP50210.1 FtsX-like permease family protein [Catalinimonas niigatensis]
MYKNYFKNAYRYLGKHPLATAINLFGLASGICVCFFALLYVRFELSYDRHHAQADRIYRLVTDVNTASGITYESTSAPMAPSIQANFPEVEAFTRIMPDYLMVQKEDRSYFKEENIAYADPSLFRVFTLPLISGDSATALEAPFQMVLSETAALHYFGTTDCLGKILLLDESPAVVSAVMRDMPYNAHYRIDILVSLSTLLDEWNPSMKSQWKRFGFYSYLLLHQDKQVEALEVKISAHLQEHIAQQESEYKLSLEPLTDLYLHAKARGSRYGSSVSGDISNIYIFSVVAVFVLFIACFNFINLTTVLSLQRAKEIGVRKSLGATRAQLIGQFLFDALHLSFLALGMATVLCVLLIPAFQQLSGKIIRLHFPEHALEFLWLIAGTLLVGLLSGIYPALFLSRLSPFQGLIGSVKAGRNHGLLRKSLIISQFAISIILISATGIVYQQLHYMQNHALGFDKNHKLVMDFYFDSKVVEHQESVKQQLAEIPGIQQISFSSAVPAKANRKYTTEIENANQQKQEMMSDAYFVDDDFLKQYGIALVAGRAFSADIASDSTEAMLINEAALRSLGYHDPEEVIGKPFVQQGRSGEIIGVVKDFHYHSFREEVRPLTLRVSAGGNPYTYLTLDITSSDLRATIKQVEEVWSASVSEKPFGYFFLDEAFQAQYLAEERFGKLFTCFALLAVLLSCLGLLGLSAFSIKGRVKEIGIRKVLGASVGNILLLLSKDFIKLILIAFFVAIPVANYLLTEWLHAYAYRMALSWWFFVVPGSLVLLLALLTISLQTIKAARQNPVDSLKYE